MNKIKSSLNNQIKLAILKKATLLKNQDLKKKGEERGPIKLPGKSFK